jgi:putative peptidoglycan lipid II flippase
MAFLALGDVIIAAVYQTGRFRRGDVLYVWGILAGAAVGLLASTLARLYSSTYYALRDTRTPLKYAVVRVALTTGLGYLCAVPCPHWLGLAPRWGVAGLTASAGFAGWVEFALLRRTLNRRIGRTGLAPAFLARLWASAAAAAAAGAGVQFGLGPRHPVSAAALILSSYGAVYFLATSLAGVPETKRLVEIAKRVSGLNGC